MVDVAVPSTSETRETGELEGLGEEPEKAWKVKVTVVAVIIGAID